MSGLICHVLLRFLCLGVVVDVIAKKPNIILIVADDYGFHDVGYHNTDMMTPNIDKVRTTYPQLERTVLLVVKVVY